MANSIERLQCFMSEKGLNDNQMTVAAGLSNGLLGKAKNSSKGLNSTSIEKILFAYPDLSAEWLLTGRGEMLKSAALHKETVREPLVSLNPAVGVPYYDVDFLGGFALTANDQTTVPANNIVIQGFERATCWCNVTGHSMEPRINHGDIIALRECRLDRVQYGEIYAVVLTNDMRTIKTLRKSANPAMMRYIPINPEYDEQEFPMADVIHIFEVIGSICKFF